MDDAGIFGGDTSTEPEIVEDEFEEEADDVDDSTDEEEMAELESPCCGPTGRGSRAVSLDDDVTDDDIDSLFGPAAIIARRRKARRESDPR